MVEAQKQQSLERERVQKHELAPLIEAYNHKKPFSKLEYTKQFLLRCTDGIFQGKFLYINMTPDGEVFGSGDPEINEDITMYIEEANLSLRHASILYSDKNGQTFMEDESGEIDEYNGRYILKDCGSDLGTWVRIPKANC